MKNLDQIDPLPKFESVGTYTRPDGAQIWSKRQNEEWAKARQKQSGEDWQPYKRDGQIVPHTYINGQGKLKTEGYQPPEPPETDVILMVNADCYELFWPDGVPQEDWVPTFVDDLDSVVKNVPGLTEHRFKLTELRALYTAT
jgi:hypothetical protein